MENSCLHVGMRAPNFTATTALGQITLSDYCGSWLVLFSHPGDFTTACTAEFLAFAQAADQFAALQTQLLGLSMESGPAHVDWAQSIYLATGVHIPFPMVADHMGEIAKIYGMNLSEINKTPIERNAYIIDPMQVIRAICVYPSMSSRSIDNILCLVAALQLFDEEVLITPAGFSPGQPGVSAPEEICR